MDVSCDRVSRIASSYKAMENSVIDIDIDICSV